MITVYKTEHLRWEGNISVDCYVMFADQTTDIPTSAAAKRAVIGNEHKMAQGSVVYVIDTGEAYMMESDGTWKKQ